jgi:hypothetical protein
MTMAWSYSLPCKNYAARCSDVEAAIIIDSIGDTFQVSLSVSPILL